MNEANLSSLCHGLSPLLQLVGELLLVFKLVIPILLVVICILDVAKAILSSKSDENKNRLKNFFYRVLFAVLLLNILCTRSNLTFDETPVSLSNLPPKPIRTISPIILELNRPERLFANCIYASILILSGNLLNIL